MRRLVVTTMAVLFLSTSVFAQSRTGSDAKPVSIAEKTAGMQKFAGYFPFYWDAKAGKILAGDRQVEFRVSLRRSPAGGDRIE